MVFFCCITFLLIPSERHTNTPPKMADKTTTTESAAPTARMTVPELQAILKQRGLKQGGRKAELLARLGVAEEPGKKAAVVKQKKAAAPKSGFLYGYDMCFPTPLDPSEVVFKAGRSAESTGPFQRLLTEFGYSCSPAMNWIEGKSSRILVCRVDLQNSEAEQLLFDLIVAQGARRWGCLAGRKELFTHTSLDQIEKAMNELISNYGGEWLNYWELKEEYHLVDKLWDNISQFKNWLVTPGDSLEYRLSKHNEAKTAKNDAPLLRTTEALKIKTAGQLKTAVDSGDLGFGKTGGEKSTKADIVYIFHQGLIKFTPVINVRRNKK